MQIFISKRFCLLCCLESKNDEILKKSIYRYSHYPWIKKDPGIFSVDLCDFLKKLYSVILLLNGQSLIERCYRLILLHNLIFFMKLLFLSLVFRKKRLLIYYNISLFILSEVFIVFELLTQKRSRIFYVR